MVSYDHDIAGDRNSFQATMPNGKMVEIVNMTGTPVVCLVRHQEIAIRSTSRVPTLGSRGKIYNLELLDPYKGSDGYEWAIISEEVAGALHRAPYDNRLIARFAHRGSRPKLINGNPCLQLRALDLHTLYPEDLDLKRSILEEIDFSSVDATAINTPS